MKFLMNLCILCDLLFIPLLLFTKSYGHKINVIYLHEGEEIDRWWFYEPLEIVNLTEKGNRVRRKAGVNAIYIGGKKRCVKGKKNREQVAMAEVVPRYGTAYLACRTCGMSLTESIGAKTWFRWTKEVEKGGDQVVWKPEEVKLDTHDRKEFNRVYVGDGHKLVIKDFRPSDVGTYFCVPFSKKAKQSKFAFKAPKKSGEESAVSFALVYKRLVGTKGVDYIYHLDIESQAEGLEMSTVSTSYATMKKPRKNITDVNENWISYSQWGEWSKCSRCRETGEKKRIGTCMIRKKNPKKKSFPSYVEGVLSMYKDGAPCHSTLFRHVEKFHKTAKEIQVESCTVKCTGESKYDLFANVRRANESEIGKDFKSRVKFHISVSDKSGSMLGAKLKAQLTGVKEPIKKNFTQGMKAKLVCITKADKTLKWFKNNTQLLNTYLAQNESYRIKISSKGHLNFQEVKARDAGPYKCTYKNGQKKRQWIIRVKKTIKPNWVFYYLILGASYCGMFVVFLIALVIRTTYLINTKKKNFHQEKRKKEEKEGLLQDDDDHDKAE